MNDQNFKYDLGLNFKVWGFSWSKNWVQNKKKIVLVPLSDSPFED